MKVTKAVIPIAGIGSRFLPATKCVAKELFPVIDKPCLQLILEECANSGITDVFLVISPSKEYVKQYFIEDKKLDERLEKDGKSEFMKSWHDLMKRINVTFGYQMVARGSGDALFPAEKWVGKEPFAVLFGDDINYTPENNRPVIGQLIDVYEKYGKQVIGCKRVSYSEIHKYSAVIPTKKLKPNVFEVSGIVEKPKSNPPSNISGLARYIVTPSIFKVLHNLPESKTGEIGLTEAMHEIAKTEGSLACIFKSIRYDTGDKFGYVQSLVEYALRDPRIQIQAKAYFKKLVKANFDLVEIKSRKNK